MNVSELIAYLSQFPPTSSVELKISGFDDSEDGRLNLFGLVNGAMKTEVGYPLEFVKNIQDCGTSRNQMYKQAGNSVSPPVIAAILKELLK